MVVVVEEVVVVGLPTTRTNERTNESFGYVIYNNNIRISVSKIVNTKKLKSRYDINKDLPREPHPGLSPTLSQPGLVLVSVAVPTGERPLHTAVWQLTPQ